MELDKLFTPKKEEIIVLKDENKIDLSKTTKGDRKKLYAQGKITAEQINKVQ